MIPLIQQDVEVVQDVQHLQLEFAIPAKRCDLSAVAQIPTIVIRKERTVAGSGNIVLVQIGLEPPGITRAAVHLTHNRRIGLPGTDGPAQAQTLFFVDVVIQDDLEVVFLVVLGGIDLALFFLYLTVAIQINAFLDVTLGIG